MSSTLGLCALFIVTIVFVVDKFCIPSLKIFSPVIVHILKPGFSVLFGHVFPYGEVCSYFTFATDSHRFSFFGACGSVRYDKYDICVRLMNIRKCFFLYIRDPLGSGFYWSWVQRVCL